MNRHSTYLILAGLTLLTTACHDDLAEQSAIQQEPLELRAAVQQQYVTRASDGGFADGDQMGVFIVNYTGDEAPSLLARGNHADNVRFTYGSDGKWTGSYQLYWKDKQTPVDAYGYYPFDAEMNDIDAYPFSIQRNQRDNLTTGRQLTGYEQSDFLWAMYQRVTPGMPIHLQMSHIMAGIEVSLVEGEDFDEGEWATLEKSVLVMNTMLETTIDIATGNVTVTGQTPKAIIPQQHGASWRAVVAPQTVGADETLLAVTVDGVSYNFHRSEPITFYPSKLHRFTIKVDKRVEKGDYLFTLLGESITPWENDPLSHQGQAKEYVVVGIEDGQYLGDVIRQMGLDPDMIVNLKLTGTMSVDDNWYDEWPTTPLTEDTDKQSNLWYIRHCMPHLEALNLKELRLKHARIVWVTDEISGDSRRWLQDNYGYDDGDGYDDVIPFRAFFGLQSLNSIVFPDHLVAICEKAFLSTNLSGSCILPDGLRFIGDKAFSTLDEDDNHFSSETEEGLRCHFTGELYLPSTVEYIGYYAFYRQDFTNELVLPHTMTYLGKYAFGYCKHMTGYLRIPEGLTEVNNAWWGMTGLKGWAEVPQGVKKVNGIGCPFSTLYIPEGVTHYGWTSGDGSGIEPDTYNDTYGGLPFASWRKTLREAYLPSTLTNLGMSAFAGTGIRHITLPEALEIIPSCCFAQCEELQDTFHIPQNVYRIGERAFRGCKMLEAVTIPASVGIIEDLAFADCYSLNYIECMAAEPPQLSSTAFDGVEKNNFTLVVPEASVTAYRNAEGWREFKRIAADYSFVCRPMQEKLLNKGHQYTMVLNSDGNWTMTHCPSWAHISTASGYKKTELTVSVDDLAHGQGNRTDSIVFTLSDRTDSEGNPITCYYRLAQYDYQYEEDATLALQTSTQGNGKINILLCGDGYDAQDIAEGKYLSDMRQVAEYFFAVEPYTTYKGYFNVKVAFAMSRESGINSINQWRETKFGATLAGGSERLKGEWDAPMQYALTVAPEISPTVAAPPLVIMPLNTDQYEGVTKMWDDGSAVAVFPMSTEAYPCDARGLVQHEAGGHGFGHFADEYIYHGDFIQICPCLCCPHVEELKSMKGKGWARNLSLTGKYKDAEWRQLIFDKRYGDICDIYEGGYFHQRGVYRSEVNSCMNNNVPYYSTVSRMAIVERIKQYAGEAFDYEDFVAHDSRDYGSKFITRSTQTSAGAAGGRLSAPVFGKGSVENLLNKKK